MDDRKLVNFGAFLRGAFPGHSTQYRETDRGYTFRLDDPHGRRVCVVTVSEEFLEDTTGFSRVLGPGGLDLQGAIRYAPNGVRVHVTSGHGVEYAVYQLVSRTSGSADWKPMPEAMIRQGRDGGLGVAPRTRSECEAWREHVFPASDVEFGMLNTSTDTIEPMTARV